MKIPRIAVYVDGPNFFYLQKNGLKWFADPKLVLSWAESNFEGQVVDARYYLSSGDEGNESQRQRQHQFTHALPHMGYSVQKRNVVHVRDGNESWTEARLTYAMMLDAAFNIDNYDIFVLISGSGDFEELATRLRQNGKEVAVLATDDRMSNELRAAVGQWYTNFEDIRSEVQK